MIMKKSNNALVFIIYKSNDIFRVIKFKLEKKNMASQTSKQKVNTALNLVSFLILVFFQSKK